MDLVEAIMEAGVFTPELITLEVGSRGPYHPPGFDKLEMYLNIPKSKGTPCSNRLYKLSLENPIKFGRREIGRTQTSLYLNKVVNYNSDSKLYVCIVCLPWLDTPAGPCYRVTCDTESSICGPLVVCVFISQESSKKREQLSARGRTREACSEGLSSVGP